MHHKIYALENTPAELCASTSFTDDAIIADIIRDKYLERGLIAVIETEGDNGEKRARRFLPTLEQVENA